MPTSRCASNRIAVRRASWLATAILFVASGCTRAAAPDTIIRNAKVFTGDAARPWAEAVAVKGERIIAVGESAALAATAGASTRVLDAGGRVLVPGFNDAHVHIGIGPDTGRLTLPADPTLDQIAEALAKAVAELGAPALVRGTIGITAWEDPRLDRAWLDARAAGHAVWLQVWTGHGEVVNSAALTLIGVDDAIRDPRGGRYGRDAGGRLNGRLIEYAGFGAGRRLAERTPTDAGVAIYRAFGMEVARLGITSVQLFATATPAATTARQILAADPPQRFRIFRFPTAEAGAPAEDEAPVLPPQPGPRIEVRGAKWILDGTPVERFAAQSAPYADRPRESGALNLDTATLEAAVKEAYGTESQLAIHAVGDAAIEAYVSALERIGTAEVWRRKRPRLEHGDGLTPSQLTRAAALGLVVVQNPAHLLIGDVMAARLGPRAASVQPLASLLTAGVPLALGSDGPLSPLLNIAWATTHPSRPREALTREQAVAAYTRGAAFAEGAERDKGWLGPGTLADLAILSDDVFTAPADRLGGITSVLTMVGGAIVYDAGVLPH